VVIIGTIAACFEMLRYYVLRGTAMANGFQYNIEGMANQQWEMGTLIASMMMMMMMIMMVVFFHVLR